MGMTDAKAEPPIFWLSDVNLFPCLKAYMFGIRRIDAFELWYWRRLLRVPWTARRSNQSILKEINPEYSLEGLMLKLKLQYFGHVMQRVQYCKVKNK